MRSRIRIAAGAIILIGGMELTIPSTASAFDTCPVCTPLVRCPEQAEGEEYCDGNCGPSWTFEGCVFDEQCWPSTTVSCRWGA